MAAAVALSALSTMSMAQNCMQRAMGAATASASAPRANAEAHPTRI
jgi:hypothetical protein